MKLTIEQLKRDYPDYKDYQIISDEEFSEELKYANFSEDHDDDYSVIITSDNIVLANEI